MTTLQKYLNDMAGTSGVGEQRAANIIAGTTNLGIQGALNAVCGTSGVGIQQCLNTMAGTTGLAVAAAAGAASVKNLLSANQADVETDTTGHQAGSNAPTIARSTAQAAHGLACLSLTATSNNTMGSDQPNASAVTGIVVGTTYTAVGYARPFSTVRNARILIQWTTGANAFVANSAGSFIAEDAGAWKKYTVSAAAPATAAKAHVIFEFQSAVTSEVHYIDKLGFFLGTSTVWTP